MAASDPSERYSRQVILPGVGVVGQQRWSEATVLLAGEGLPLDAAQTAFKTSGVPNVLLFPLESVEYIPSANLAVVLTENTQWRRQLSRHFRKVSQPALFGWSAGSGYALFFSRHSGGHCPCLECFETLNPKVFGKTDSSTAHLLGALAASESLQWILRGETPIDGKVWITSLEEGVSFWHEVKASYKCPARLLEEGAPILP